MVRALYVRLFNCEYCSWLATQVSVKLRELRCASGPTSLTRLRLSLWHQYQPGRFCARRVRRPIPTMVLTTRLAFRSFACSSRFPIRPIRSVTMHNHLTTIDPKIGKSIIGPDSNHRLRIRARRAEATAMNRLSPSATRQPSQFRSSTKVEHDHFERRRAGRTASPKRRHQGAR